MEDEIDAIQVQDDRPRGVSKAKLADVNLAPKLSVFYRRTRNEALTPLEVSFPKEAAKIFCDRIRADVEHVRDDIESSHVHAFILTGGDQTAYKKIFAWIQECVQSQSIEKFPDLPEPENDPFTATLNVIIASHRLGVPAGSLSYHLEKRLNNCARKNLMPLSQVRDFYNIDFDTYKVDFRAVACSSIFNAWWDGRLDEAVNPELMEELADMRLDMAELDDDLHDACKKREEEVRSKWAEKKAKKLAEQNAGSGEWDHTRDTKNVAVADTSQDAVNEVNGHQEWDTSNQDPAGATFPNSTDWNNENVKPSVSDAFTNGNDLRKSAVQDLAYNDSDITTGGDWADEMNERVPEPVQTVPVMQW